jgi:hypothetical protein
MAYKDLRHKNRIHRIWKKMKERCSNPRAAGYKYYGKKGVTVCKEWLIRKKGFLNFKRWALNNGYADNLTLDRKEANKGYCPSNCRWISKTNNSRYKGSTKMTIDKVKAMRDLYRTGDFTQKKLAGLFNIAESNVGRITRKETWRDIN